MAKGACTPAKRHWPGLRRLLNTRVIAKCFCYLEEWLRYAEVWNAAWEAEPRHKDLVFPSLNGGPMDRDNLAARHFKPLLKRGELPDIRLYDLRHTFATLWLESGEHPKILQEILGHSRISVTLDIYSHVIPHMQREAMSRFGHMFSKPS